MKQTILFINVITLIVILMLIYHSYQHRREKGGLPFLCNMVLLLSWVAGSTIELFTQSYEAKIFWRNFIQIGMAMIPLTNLWFVMEYTENKNKYLRCFIQISAVISLIGICLTFTDQMHHLIRKSAILTELNGQISLIVEPAILGNIFVLFRFVLMFFSIIVLVLFQIRVFKNGQKQVFYILTGFIMALGLLIIKNYLLSDSLDLIPMSVIFLIPNLFIAYSIYRYDFLKITPLAKDWIINSLPDGIVVLSSTGEIVEVNQSAEMFFGYYTENHEEPERQKKWLKNKWKYVRYTGFLRSQQLWRESLTERRNGIVEIELEKVPGAKTYYEIDSHHFIDTSGHYSGCVSVIRNVTSFKLEKMMLKQQIEMDHYVQILNKQAYIDYVNGANATPVSFLVIDIDKFKIVNDQYGHPVGDEVILKVVAAIKQCIRKNDLIGRIGGDEFSVTLMNCSRERTQIIVRDILTLVQQETIDLIEEKVTVSIGVVTDLKLPDCNFAMMYQKADEALYAAKKSGGNQAIFDDINSE